MHYKRGQDRARSHLSIVYVFGCSGEVLLVVSNVGTVDEHVKRTQVKVVIVVVIVANTSANTSASASAGAIGLAR